MKIKAIITVAALAGSVSFAAADERTFGDGGIPERIKELADTNGDDEVSEEEWQAFKGARKDERKARRADRRAEWDTDGNGLSDDEKEAARDAIRAKIEEKRNARHAEADTGGGEDGEPDGLIDIDEFLAISSIAKFAERHPEMAQAIFNRLAGTDDDAETISAEEFTSHLGKRRPVRPKFPKPSRPDHGGGDLDDGDDDEADDDEGEGDDEADDDDDDHKGPKFPWGSKGPKGGR